MQRKIYLFITSDIEVESAMINKVTVKDPYPVNVVSLIEASDIVYRDANAMGLERGEIDVSKTIDGRSMCIKKEKITKIEYMDCVEVEYELTYGKDIWHSKEYFLTTRDVEVEVKNIRNFTTFPGEIATSFHSERRLIQ